MARKENTEKPGTRTPADRVGVDDVSGDAEEHSAGRVGGADLRRGSAPRPFAHGRRGAGMIDRIVIKNFKSFRNVDLKLGRDEPVYRRQRQRQVQLPRRAALPARDRPWHDNQRDLDGKPRTPIQEVWKGIRGGSRYACFAGAENTDEITIDVYGKLTKAPERRWEYRIVFSPGSGTAAYEHFSVESEWYTYSGDDHSLWRSGNQRTRRNARPSMGHATGRSSARKAVSRVPQADRRYRRYEGYVREHSTD